MLSGLQHQSPHPQPLPEAVDETPQDFAVELYPAPGGGQDIVSRARRVDLSDAFTCLPFSWRFGTFSIGPVEDLRRIDVLLDEATGSLCVDGRWIPTNKDRVDGRQDWRVEIPVGERKSALTFYRFSNEKKGRHLYYQSNDHLRALLLSTDTSGRQILHELQFVDTGTLCDWRFPTLPMRSEQFIFDFGFGDYGAIGREMMERVLADRAKGKSWKDLIADFAADPDVTPLALDVLRRNQHYDWEIFGHLPPSIFAKIKDDLRTNTPTQLLESYKTDPAITPEMWQLVARNLQQNEIRLLPSYAVDQDGDGTLETTEFFGTPFTLSGMELTLQSVPPSGEKAVFSIRKSPAHQADDLMQVHPGDVAPAITGPVIFGPQKGETITIGGKSKDFSGKIVVVDFWATWCGPCLRGFPHLLSLKEKFADKPVAILGINRDFDIHDPAFVVKYIEAAHLQQLSEVRNLTPEQWQNKFAEFATLHPQVRSLVYLTDRDNVSGRLWGVNAIPAIFLVDGNTGKILAQGDALRDPSVLETEILRHLPRFQSPAKP